MVAGDDGRDPFAAPAAVNHTRWIIGGVVVVAVIVVVIVLVAGGGSSSSSATLSHADYVKQANAICETDVTKVIADERNNALGAAQADLAAAAAHLKALKPPAADQAKAAEFTADVDRGVAALKALNVTEFQSALNSAASLATELGLDVCANG